MSTDAKQINAAFVKAQTSFAPALKSATNPHYKSRYADLAACVEAVLDALNANGIALTQRTHLDETGITVETVLLHESGESLSGGLLHVPASKQDPQGYGSALTYARRYSLMAACGIAPEDDDGEAAKAPPPRAASKPPREEPAQTPKRTWKDAVAEITDAKSAESAALKLHEHFVTSGAEPHDTVMRHVLAKIAQLVGEKKIDETPGSAISQIVREWIIEPTEMEETERQAGQVF